MSHLNPTTITFIIYILGMIVLGFLAYKYTTNLSDYILGGRKLGSFVTAMSAGASDMSGWLLMGLPGAIYVSGLVDAWIAIGLTVGAYLNWLFVSGRLRVHTELNHNSLTLPDFFFHRYENGQAIKIISAFVILLFFTIYCASGVVAGARLFENLFGVPYHLALWYGAGATILYTLIGGFLAVSWTDTVQASFMIFALILAPIVILINVGGYENAQMVIIAAGEAIGKDYPNLIYNTSFIATISAVAWGLGYCGQPHILARFMAADSVKSLKKARRIGMTWMVLTLAGAVAVGYFGIAYFNLYPEVATTVNQNSEYIFIELAQLLFNPWIAGILLSAILAAVMSTLSCQLLICSSAITSDFYKGYIRPNATQRELVLIGRIMVLLIAIIAIIIAQDPNSKVLGLVANAWAGFGCAFGPVIIYSLFWKRTNSYGVLAGMITGTLVVMVWKYFPYNGGLYEMVPGFIAASIMIYVVSILTPAPSKAVVDKFNEINDIYKTQS